MLQNLSQIGDQFLETNANAVGQAAMNFGNNSQMENFAQARLNPQPIPANVANASVSFNNSASYQNQAPYFG